MDTTQSTTQRDQRVRSRSCHNVFRVGVIELPDGALEVHVYGGSPLELEHEVIVCRPAEGYDVAEGLARALGGIGRVQEAPPRGDADRARLEACETALTELQAASALLEVILARGPGDDDDPSAGVAAELVRSARETFVDATDDFALRRHRVSSFNHALQRRRSNFDEALNVVNADELTATRDEVRKANRW